MTEQYAETNINNPQLPRLVANSPSSANIILTPDDGFLVIDTALAEGLAILPLAQSMPGRSIKIVAPVGSTNTMGFEIQGSDTLVFPAGVGVLIGTDNGTQTATSDGAGTWYVTADLT
jgi:hypothetical protein